MKPYLKLTKDEEQRAVDLYRKSTIIDGQNVAPIDAETLEILANAGVTALHTAGERYGRFGEIGIPALTKISDVYRVCDESHGKAFVATSADQIERAKSEGKIALVLHFGKLNAIEEDVNLLRAYYKLGVRTAQIAFNEAGMAGGGCAEKRPIGLTNFGEEVIAMMNHLGMLIDLSHANDATADATISLSKDPVVFSHSDARAVNNNRRNVADDQAKAVAEKGGLIGVIFSASFLGAGVKKPIEALSVDDVMDHVDHLVKLIGIDHVAFGSDFSAKKGAARNELYIQKHPGVAPFAGLKPNDLNEMPKLVNIAKGMVARGYSDQEIQKFLGLNWIKVWERVWK